MGLPPERGTGARTLPLSVQSLAKFTVLHMEAVADRKLAA